MRPKSTNKLNKFLISDETITYKSEADEESKEMHKLATIALNAAKKIAVLYENNPEYKNVYPDIWKFIGKVRLPQPYCPVSNFFNHLAMLITYL